MALLYKYQKDFFFKEFFPWTIYGFYFESNGQRISNWDNPSWPTKSVEHVRSHRTFTKKLNVLVLRSQSLNGFNHISKKSHISQKTFCDPKNVFPDAGLINSSVP